jgi:hypothetical protein
MSDLTLRSRDLEVPRIRPGVRVRFDDGKWNCCANSVRHDSTWASRPWASTRLGVTVEIQDFTGSIYPEHSPWGLPSFATPVLWDGEERVTWVRTSCVDIIEDEAVLQAGQQVLLFEGVA